MLWNQFYVATVIRKQAKLEGLKIHAYILKMLFSLPLYKLVDHCMRCLTPHDVLPYV